MSDSTSRMNDYFDTVSYVDEEGEEVTAWPDGPGDDDDEPEVSAEPEDQSLSVRLAMLNLDAFDLGGTGSGNFGHKGRPGEVGGSSEGKGGSPEHAPESEAGSAPVLEGVDVAANAASETERFLLEHERTGERPTPEALAAAEAELRSLPLIHATTSAGAVGMAEDGLLSNAGMKAKREALDADVASLRAEMADLIDTEDASLWRPGQWLRFGKYADDHGRITSAAVDQIAQDFGLEHENAKALVEKADELMGIERVLSGHTGGADRALGLDQFAFLTHGRGVGYGSVQVVVDNDVLNTPHAFATEDDIVRTPGTTGAWESKEYAEGGVATYKSHIVKGDGYYKAAAARAGSAEGVASRRNDQLHEVKVPHVPPSKVKGFIVANREEGERLSKKLAERGITGKVLYMEDASPLKPPSSHTLHQLKSMQATGEWDEKAMADLVKQGKAGVL